VPGDGSLPTTGWVKDEVVTDKYLVPMDEDAPPWQYTIIVGMYDPITGDRLRVSGAEDQNSVVLGTIQVE
jgi:hypothetical protein